MRGKQQPGKNQGDTSAGTVFDRSCGEGKTHRSISTDKDKTLPRLKAPIIAGAANNQLAEKRHGQALADRGILYAPDYVINAGGIIEIFYEESGNYDENKVREHLERIGKTLATVFKRAEQDKRPTGEIADRMAEEIFRR